MSLLGVCCISSGFESVCDDASNVREKIINIEDVKAFMGSSFEIMVLFVSKIVLEVEKFFLVFLLCS
ncbi:hypothetical protein GCM10007877_08170 [Marinibactrum halimedae]|uniref:Uncharacterized protein n=1 Tax=Marinibactrum halimedae TaxID=1444977 RepID=A0AA37T2C0_9GAMM|nr:hypothetical protein GCM10007877_08170 [Marinibactrum halimedae]